MIGKFCVAAVIFAQIAGSSRVGEQSLDRTVVLVLSPSSGQTFGSGFLIQRGERVYVVTCRHVIEEAKTRSLLAVPTPKKTRALLDTDLLKLDVPMYHPNDSSNSTYDIAVLRVLGATVTELRQRGIELVRLEASPASAIKDGLLVHAAGYPVDYAETQLALRSSDALSPLRVRGSIKTVPLDSLTQHGFAAPLREGHFAETVERPLGKGASGGPVYADDTGETGRVVGVLVGSAETQNPHTIGFVFASASRIIETIRSRSNRRPHPTAGETR